MHPPSAIIHHSSSFFVILPLFVLMPAITSSTINTMVIRAVMASGRICLNHHHRHSCGLSLRGICFINANTHHRSDLHLKMIASTPTHLHPNDGEETEKGTGTGTGEEQAKELNWHPPPKIVPSGRNNGSICCMCTEKVPETDNACCIVCRKELCRAAVCRLWCSACKATVCSSSDSKCLYRHVTSGRCIKDDVILDSSDSNEDDD